MAEVMDGVENGELSAEERRFRRNLNVEAHLNWCEKLTKINPNGRIKLILRRYRRGARVNIIAQLMGMSRKKTERYLHRLEDSGKAEITRKDGAKRWIAIDGREA